MGSTECAVGWMVSFLVNRMQHAHVAQVDEVGMTHVRMLGLEKLGIRVICDAEQMLKEHLW